MKTVEFLKSNNVNVDAALELFGDMDTYNETMKEFQNGINEKVSMIEKYYNEGDMPNYAIYVHSLKSDCKYFGFMTLADLAYQHEMASKANNIDFVKANYAALMDEVRVVKNIVNEYMEEGTPVVENSASIAPAQSKDIILVADDSEVIRLFVKKIFDDTYEIASAKDGEETLNIIKEQENTGKIKAILLDLNMPKVDGFAVLEYLKEKDLFSKMPVTIISGDSSSDAINRAFTYPIIDMINKPFNEDKIKNAVMKTIGI